MHRTEPTRLQSLALQLSEKVSSLMDNNEKMAEMKQGGLYQRQGSFGIILLFLHLSISTASLIIQLVGANQFSSQSISSDMHTHTHTVTQSSIKTIIIQLQ